MKVVTFNLLAQCRIGREMYSYSAPGSLKWRHRRDLFVDLISSFHADILALQEVDMYEEFWREYLQGIGLQGIYVPKRSDGIGDGLYIGWKKGQYDLLQHDAVDMSCTMRELVEQGAYANIGLIVRLHDRKKGNDFVFCTTHLYWAPGFDSLRKKQIVFLVQECTRLHPTIPTILCGDLNSDPHSLCCQYLQTLGFQSVCCCSLPYTVCSDNFVDTLDYIWIFPKDKFEATDCSLLDIHSLPEKYIPNLQYPSDHFPIGANIQIAPSGYPGPV